MDSTGATGGAGSISNIGGILRMGGLATGLDTDSIVKQLMQVERVPLDKLNQKNQIYRWQKDDYRDVTNTLRSFQSTYLDILSSTNMTSPTAYLKYTATSSDPTTVTASGTASALPGTHIINSVTTLASAANTVSTASVSNSLTGSAPAALDYTNANTLNVTLNGVTKTITLRNGAYATTANLISNGVDGIQDSINNAFGAGKITVSDAGGGVLNFAAASSRVTLTSGSTNDALANLRFTSGSSNRINTSSQLQSIGLTNGLTFDGANNLNFTINGVNFSIAQTATLNDLMNQVNSSTAGVTMSYSELTDKFTFTAQQKGAGNNIVISNGVGGNLFGASTNINPGTFNNGTDASFSLDGIATVRNDNNFTVDGVTYNLLNTNAAPTTITLNQDVDGVVTNIKNFVSKYNDTLDKLNTYLSEKKYKDFPPLTDTQKSQMKDQDINDWQTKAKSGLLNSDPLIQNIVDQMRKSLSDTLTGISGSLSSIGITTVSYQDKGKLVIDETKLRSAIQSNPTQVQNLFSKQSTINYSPDLTSAQRSQRYSEEGVINRLSDIIQDNIRTTRNAGGQKGILIEKAGLIGDLTEFNNLIDQSINRNNTDISNLQARLTQKEQNYYKKFSALETAISKLSAQGSWLSQQFSGGGSK